MISTSSSMRPKGCLDDDERLSLLWDKPPKGPGSAKWSLHDAVLIGEATDLMERTPSLGHVVLDEAQDLSAMMLRSVGRQATTGSMTVLGDLAQATTPWSVGSWQQTLDLLGQPEAAVEELTLGFRVPGDVIAYAARLLPTIAPTLEPPTSVRRAAGELSFLRSPTPAEAAIGAVTAALDAEGSVGLIVADASLADCVSAATDAGLGFSVLGQEPIDSADTEFESRLDLVPSSLAKGLEFDHVVLVEPADIAAGESDELTGLRRLYVCLTRAVTSLVVVHARPLPSALGDAGVERSVGDDRCAD